MIGGANGPVTLRKIPEKAPIALGDAAIGSGRPSVQAPQPTGLACNGRREKQILSQTQF